MISSSPSSTPLASVTVWLSSAAPELQCWEGRSLDSEVLDSAARLTALVLRQRGNILHVAHPSSAAVLLEQARRAQYGRDRVTLAVSKFLAREIAADLRGWKPFCRVIETEVGLNAHGHPAREPPLAILRARMAEDAHAFVAVGGIVERRTGSRRKSARI